MADPPTLILISSDGGITHITTEMRYRLPSIIRATRHRLGAYVAPSKVNWAYSLYLSQTKRKWHSSNEAAVKEKPYYITSPIFYVNAGLLSVRIDSETIVDRHCC